ncbi:hypothetical protein ACS0TY_036659 [Phlomoides rotata]
MLEEGSKKKTPRRRIQDPFGMSHVLENAWSWWWHTSNPIDNRARLVLSSIIGFLAVLWIFLLFIKKSNNKYPPGPKGFPVVGNLLSHDPELHTYFPKLAKTYGPIYTLKLGKKTGVVISSPSLAKLVLKDQDITFTNRDVPVAGKVGTYGGSDIVCNPYGPVWRMLRNVCVREMLSVHNLDSVYGLRRRKLRQTIGYLYSNAGSPVNPNVSDYFPVLERFDIQGIERKMEGLMKVFGGIFEGIIDQRLKMKDEESNDFLQFLLQLIYDGDAKTPFKFHHDPSQSSAQEHGRRRTETTSNTVEYALAEMMNKPGMLKKAQQELETVVGKDKIVEASHINNLPYLHTVIKEVLRLHPSLPLLVPPLQKKITFSDKNISERIYTSH